MASSSSGPLGSKRREIGAVNPLYVCTAYDSVISEQTWKADEIVFKQQCGSSLVKIIDASLPLVWSILRQFDKPQAYKRFIKRCIMRTGNGGVGSIREVILSSGLPGKTSVERLDKLDDEKHVIKISIVGGEHKLVNYKSTTTVHGEEGRKTVVIESYVVDIPAGSSKEDTCLFVNTIIGYNHRSLAEVSERITGN